MNKRIVCTLVLVLLLGSLAQAQDGRRLRPNALNSIRFGLYMAENDLFEARIVLRLKDEIGLTAAQEQKIENLMLAYEEKAIRRSSDIKVLELKFAAVVKGRRVDRGEMEKLARQIGNLRTDLQVGHLNYLLDVRDVLSPEQVQKLGTLRDKFRQRAPLRPMGGQDTPGMPPPPPDGGEEADPEAPGE